MNVRAVLVGIVIGLVFGAGIASLVWALTSDGSGNDDVAAVCGVIERTPVPNMNTSIEELRRWGVSEVMPSVAKANPEYKPMADALDEALQSMRQLDFDKMTTAIDRAKEFCS